MFSCEYCKIFINTYFEEHLQMGLLADFETSCPMRLLLAAILKLNTKNLLGKNFEE